jgi:2-hydroxychromene-2-carboxylate isomerase
MTARKKQIDYYFTPISPWAYLGAARLRVIAETTGAVVNHRPMDLARVFAATGGLPLRQRSAERQAYRLIELKRFRDHLGVPLNLHPAHFPKSGDLAARTIIAAQRAGHEPSELAEALGRALWAEERDIADAPTVRQIVEAQGLPGDELVAAATEPLVQAIYSAYTDEALARGVFGAPTYFYGDEPFWGQDRLDFLERALVRDA